MRTGETSRTLVPGLTTPIVTCTEPHSVVGVHCGGVFYFPLLLLNLCQHKRRVALTERRGSRTRTSLKPFEANRTQQDEGDRGGKSTGKKNEEGIDRLIDSNMGKKIGSTKRSFVGHIAVVLISVAYLTLGISPWSMLWKGAILLLTPLQIPSSPPPGSLKAAILNVTNDFTELSNVVQEFFAAQPADSGLEAAFIEFLEDKGRHSMRRLESGLDILLTIYKFVFPFVLLSVLSRVGGGSHRGSVSHEK